jgi:hypothetical protein
MLARQHDRNAAIATAEPLVVDSVTLDVSMSDANTTIASGDWLRVGFWTAITIRRVKADRAAEG